MNVEIDFSLVYIVIILIIVIVFKFFPPFRKNLKLQRFSPLLFILIIIPAIVKHPITSKSIGVYIAASILVVFAIVGTIRNFKKYKENTNQ